MRIVETRGGWRNSLSAAARWAGETWKVRPRDWQTDLVQRVGSGDSVWLWYIAPEAGNRFGRSMEVFSLGRQNGVIAVAGVWACLRFYTQRHRVFELAEIQHLHSAPRVIADCLGGWRSPNGYRWRETLLRDLRYSGFSAHKRSMNHIRRRLCPGSAPCVTEARKADDRCWRRWRM
jgi:hypothetical protein